MNYARSALVLALVVWFAACTHTPEEASPDALRAPPRVVAYELMLKPRHAVVEAHFRRPGGDPITLTIDPWEGADLARDVFDVHAWIDGTSERLTVTSDAPGRWTVSGAGERDFRVRYVIVGHRDDLSPGPDRGDVRGVFTGEGKALAWAQSLFVRPTLPEGAEPWEDIRVTVSAPKDWPLHTSWGRNETRFDAFDGLSMGLIVAGDWRVEDSEMEGTTLQIAVTGEWKAEERELRRQVRRLMEVQSQVFELYPTHGALVAIVPSEADQAGVLTVPGGAVFHLPVDTDLAKDALRVRQLARDHFRLWSGQIFAPRVSTEPGSPYREGHATWFSEGVTDYYAVRTMLAMRVLEARDFMPVLNGWVKDYYANPHAFTATRAELVGRFADDPDLGKLARIKGMLLALLIDVALRADSQGLVSLDDALRILADNHPEYTTADIQLAVETVSGRPWADFFTRYVDGAEVLPLVDLARGGIIVLELPFPIFDLGFRTAGGALVSASIISIVPDSEAQFAGLKIGDVVRSLSVPEGRIDQPVKVTVDRPGEGEPLTFEYLPTRDVDLPVATEMTDLFADWFR